MCSTWWIRCITVLSAPGRHSGWVSRMREAPCFLCCRQFGSNPPYPLPPLQLRQSRCASLFLPISPSPLHCNESPIYVFLFWELCGLCPSFHIHVSVSDLYIPTGSVHILPAAEYIGRSIVEIYKSLTDT
jgi:hypothetical protein